MTRVPEALTSSRLASVFNHGPVLAVGPNAVVVQRGGPERLDSRTPKAISAASQNTRVGTPLSLPLNFLIFDSDTSHAGLKSDSVSNQKPPFLLSTRSQASLSAAQRTSSNSRTSASPVPFASQEEGACERPSHLAKYEDFPNGGRNTSQRRPRDTNFFFISSPLTHEVKETNPNRGSRCPTSSGEQHVSHALTHYYEHGA